VATESAEKDTAVLRRFRGVVMAASLVFGVSVAVGYVAGLALLGSQEVRAASTMPQVRPAFEPMPALQEPSAPLASLPEQDPQGGAVPGPRVDSPLAVVQPPIRFHVQVGVFADRDQAEELASSLRARGYAVQMVSEALYRVWVGGYLDRATAEQLSATLNGAGFEALLTAQ